MSELALRRTGGASRQRLVNYGSYSRAMAPEYEWAPNPSQPSNESLNIKSKTSGTIVLRSNEGSGSSALYYGRFFTVAIRTIIEPSSYSSNIHNYPTISVWLDTYNDDHKKVSIKDIPIGDLGTLDLTYRIVEPGEYSAIGSKYGGVLLDWKFNKTTSETISSNLSLGNYVANISERIDT